MIRVRRSEERGRADHCWLDTKHTFSFASYRDPDHVHFRALRVMNEDRVAPGAGFPRHPHQDMEILSYVLEGALEHRDSLGNGSVVRAGDLQRMTAGTGIEHSEGNASATEPAHFYQIWLVPERKGLEPGYEQKSFPREDHRGRLRLAASRTGRDGSITVHQDVDLYIGAFGAGEKAKHELADGRRAWVQIVRGAVTLNGTELREGDGAAVTEETSLEITGAGNEGGELLLFDLA